MDAMLDEIQREKDALNRKLREVQSEVYDYERTVKHPLIETKDLDCLKVDWGMISRRVRYSSR